MMYGAPLAALLDTTWETTFVALGYLGLLILVIEGGMNTNLLLARQNLGLSVFVAAVGLLTPIALSLVILHLAFGYTLLQAFAAGAALSSTSLGTTFSMISQAGFATTRLGAVLSSAAIIDDVIGLVLLQVIVSLGQSTSSVNHDSGSAGIGWAIGRPLLASGSMLAVSWLSTQHIVKPVYIWLIANLPASLVTERLRYLNLAVALITCAAYTTVSSVSGTSILLGAFTSGIVIAVLSDILREKRPELPTHQDTYNECISALQTRLLRPFFFASIGFAIPVRQLFNGRVAWQGVLYAAVMAAAKGVCGVSTLVDLWRRSSRRPQSTAPSSESRFPATDSTSLRLQAGARNAAEFPPIPPYAGQSAKPSLLPTSQLLGGAMIARGEISLLILNLASTASPQLMPSDLFLVATWATLLCTLLGPIIVGATVKWMRRHHTILPREWSDPT